jgi:nanoRNase/pAp phosphatase (c-di-AMP/oligoRNAs hydrolase)
MNQVFQEIQKQSEVEARCVSFFMERSRRSGLLSYALLDDKDSGRLARQFDKDTIVATARSVADALAEQSGRIGLVCYCEPPSDSDLVQFRLRRSRRYKGFDLRNVLELFAIENGGGHEGAIGFRLPRAEVPDLTEYMERLLAGVAEASG